MSDVDIAMSSIAALPDDAPTIRARIDDLIVARSPSPQHRYNRAVGLYDRGELDVALSEFRDILGELADDAEWCSAAAYVAAILEVSSTRPADLALVWRLRDRIEKSRGEEGWRSLPGRFSATHLISTEEVDV